MKLSKLKPGVQAVITSGGGSDIGATVVAVKDMESKEIRIVELSPTFCIWGRSIDSHECKVVKDWDYRL